MTICLTFKIRLKIQSHCLSKTLYVQRIIAFSSSFSSQTRERNQREDIDRELFHQPKPDQRWFFPKVLFSTRDTSMPIVPRRRWGDRRSNYRNLLIALKNILESPSSMKDVYCNYNSDDTIPMLLLVKPFVTRHFH